MVSSPSAPDPPPPPKVPPPPPEDMDELASQRRELENRRRGRGSLVIDPGTSTGASETGLRIPTQ